VSNSIAQDTNKKSSLSEKLGFDFKSYSTLIALIVLFIVLAIVTDGGFLGARNFTNLTRQISVNAILAVGMTLVILTAGIDLSVGSVVAFSGVVAGLLQVHGGLADMGAMGAAISVVACLGTGLLCGFINGGLISVFKIPPFVITLGMMVIARGIALIVSNSQAISPMSPSFKWIAKGYISPTFTGLIFAAALFFWVKSCIKRAKAGQRSKMALTFAFVIEALCLGFPLYCFIGHKGLPLPTMILIMVAGIGIFVLRRLPFGRYIFAIGGNEEAAVLSGIAVTKIKWAVYAIIGLLSGLCGVILTARLNSATPTEGNLMELDAIAAVVIGGTSLMGGSGSIVGSIIGAFLIGTLNNGMDLLDINSNYQMVIKGLIIIFAVWSDARAKKKAV
tara:strand:- start:35958 stop:37130 length:1173 start_codon:yes stop_codon:yes gene_type:complete